MRVAIGADHAGFELKLHLVGWLRDAGHDVEDVGTHSAVPVDYPEFCAAVARRVAAGAADRGVLVGGSGQGEQIAANKINGIRAALANDVWMAHLSRAHNDANVITLGARIVARPLAEKILETWLVTPFDNGRHLRRIQQIAALEP